MSARLIDGKSVAAGLRADLARKVSLLSYRPGLAVILVGNDPASATYVRNKDKAAKETGIDARTIVMPEGTSQQALLDVIESLNADMTIDGILVQFPLPSHINAYSIIEAIDPSKDVDGFHTMNVGQLASGRAGLVPCTPRGVMLLLAHAKTVLVGARALVIGRSSLVGRPLALLLLQANATVTMAHSHTRDLPAECREADILIAATGRAEMIKGSWIKPGATVIDVGINRKEGRLVGDVAFEECARVAGAITPVPGGVGPMTIACLLENTVQAAERRRTLSG